MTLNVTAYTGIGPGVHNVNVTALDIKTAKVTPARYEDAEILRAFFRETCLKYYETLAGYEGFLLVGSILAYAAMPEIFAEYRFCAGLWGHGQRGSGKTSGISWAMNFWGMSVTSGIALSQKTSTAVGILQQTENYSAMLLWLDEFREHQVSDDKLGILRAVYDRSGQAKWSPDGVLRVMKTAFIVTGEGTSTDGATRNRYVHVQFSADKRLQNHEAWFTKHAPYFVLFGRMIMERRAEFLEHFRINFERWLKRESVADVDDRERKVHGAAYAGWLAMEALLVAYSPTELKALDQFMVSHVKSSAQDVASETNINIFWDDLLTCHKHGGLSLDSFRVEITMLAHAPDRPEQKGWKSVKFFMDPDPVIAAMQIFLTKQRSQMALKRKDVRDQMSKQPYWIDGKINKRLGPKGDMASVKVWGFEMDTHPLGYQRCTDEEVHQFIMTRRSGEPDPRQGPLYTLINAIKSKQDADEVSGASDPD
jgi:hypothetical protein